MAKKYNYSYKTRRSDALTSRMLVVFVLLLVSTFSLLYVKNWLDTPAFSLDFYPTYLSIAPYFPVLPLLLSIASVIYLIRQRKKGVDESLKVFSSTFLFMISLVLLVVSLFISGFTYIGYIPAIIFIVLVSLLYFISVSFPGSYFIITAFNALGAFAIYALHLISPIDNSLCHYGLRIATIVLAIAFGAVIYIAKKNNGKFHNVQILKPGADVLPILIAVCLFVVFVLLDMIGIGSYLIYDVILALETIIFALFYAIKTLK